MDAVDEILRAMRLTGGIFLEADFTAPWCVASRVGPEDCLPFTPAPRHIIAYHYVIAGNCLLKLENEPPIAVAGGEIVVLPRNEDHLLGSAMNLRPVSADRLIQPGPDGGLARIEHGGGGEHTRILCGFLGNDLPQNAFIAMLPSVLKLGVADGASSGWIESSLRFAAQECAIRNAQSPVILGRLAELLFMEAVRRYFASQPPAAHAWTAGLSDPVIARALGLLHGEIARAWTTEELAQESAMSRSAFADRFTRIVGEAPMRYLARLRLQLACARMRATSDAIARIAFEVGYESDAAFSRAFRREYGVPPATWRREQAAGNPDARADAPSPLAPAARPPYR